VEWVGVEGERVAQGVVEYIGSAKSNFQRMQCWGIEEEA
jgi:hypothetical protein